MSPTLTSLDPAVFLADVLAFAARHGVTDYLVPLYELTRQCFPGAEVTVVQEDDYEIADLGWIVYLVAAGDRPDESANAARSRWREAKMRTLPPAASGAFVLRVR
jgi:hypothetical protein